MKDLHKHLRHTLQFYGVHKEQVDQAIADIEGLFEKVGYAIVDKRPYRDVDSRKYIQYTINYPDGSGEFVRVPEASNE